MALQKEMERRTERNAGRIQAPNDCFPLGSRNLSVFQLTYKKGMTPPKVAFFADVLLHKLLRLLGGEEAKNKTTDLG